MYVCMYVCRTVCIYVCMYVWMDVMYVCIYMYVCMFVCMHACMYVCTYVCMYVSVYLCMYVYLLTILNAWKSTIQVHKRPPFNHSIHCLSGMVSQHVHVYMYACMAYNRQSTINTNYPRLYGKGSRDRCVLRSDRPEQCALSRV